jgi:leucyl-tRNA synthetase
MSKSRGNVINPDDVVKEYGADALRLYEMFMGPLETVKPWQTNQLAGVVRFRDRIYNIVVNQAKLITDKPPEGKLIREMNKIIKKVTLDIDNLSFNTAISALMIYSTFLNTLEEPEVSRQMIETLVLLVSPFAPHLAEECWQILGHSESLALHPWPIYNEELCVDEKLVIAIQVNGKTRATVEMDRSISEADASALALSQGQVAKHTQNKQIKKTIYVPGKILNFIVV